MFFILLFSISWFPTTYGKLQAVCSSGMNVLNDQNATALIKITGRLSNDNLQRSCVLKVDKPDSFLRVRAKRNDNSKGFLHIFLYEGGGSSLLGHVDVSEPAPVWNTLALCPAPRSGQTLGEKYMSVLGTSGLSFTVEITDSPSEVMLNKPQEANVESDNVMVFMFIPPKGISNTQLDITVTSQSDVPAYLKVSQTCEDVQGNIEVIDYKKESLRLSFAKKGRITLSKASVPPLTDSDSSWFIGIALKNATGSVKVSESKHVTLELKKSFDYSYTTPICTLIFVSLLGGILMSIIALLLFKESLVVVNTLNATAIANKSEANTGHQELLYRPPGDNNQGNNNGVEMNKCAKFGNFIVAMGEVAYNYWFSGGPKTFSYITGIVGLVLMIGAFQFVFANWYIMIQEGDRDNCYYNDFCYRVTSHDIPFNLMISNLAYIIHGLILFVCVWYMETELYLYCKSLENSPTTGKSDEKQDIQPDHVMECPNITLHLLEGAVPKHAIEAEEKAKLKALALKRKYSFSIGYAFAWALLFEGLFSTVYHLCPSRLTFQFDSAFMFVIASLTILLLYNGIEVNECPSSGRAKYPVGASNFFLFVIVPLFIFNYFGILYHSETGLTKALQVMFFISLIIWWLVVVIWAFYKLKIRKEICPGNTCVPQQHCWNECYFFLGGLAVPLLLFFLYVFYFSDLSQAFLITCIAESLVAIIAKTKIMQKLCELTGCNCRSRECTRPKCSAPTAKEIFQGVYIFFTVAFLVAALCVFQILATTDKTSSPEDSRDKNGECIKHFGGFFDWHDLWHFLSSFALLMGAFVVMFISQREQGQSNENPKQSNENPSKVSNIAGEKAGENIAGENTTELNGDEQVQSNENSSKVSENVV